MTVEEEEVKKPGQSPRDEFVEILRRLTHQISQPLTSLQGTLELALLGQLRASECGEVLQKAFEEVHRLAAAFATLQDVIEAEDPGENFQRINLKRVVRKVLKEVAPESRSRGVRLILGSLVDADVEVNPPRTEAILRELLRQLIQQGDPNRTLRTALLVRQSYAELSICDENSAAEEGVRAEAGSPTLDPGQEIRGIQLTWWRLRRSINAQGGRLETEKIPRRGICCRVIMPLASRDITAGGST